MRRWRAPGAFVWLPDLEGWRWECWYFCDKKTWVSSSPRKRGRPQETPQTVFSQRFLPLTLLALSFSSRPIFDEILYQKGSAGSSSSLFSHFLVSRLIC